MDEQTDLPCPDCVIGLFEAPAGDTVVRGCGQCGGQWLDNKACQQLVDGYLSPRARERAAQASRVAQAPRAAVAEDGPYRARARAAPDARACPFCGQGLAKHTTSSGVELDVCAAHGTWFDPYEVLKIAHAVDLEAGARLAAAYEARDRKVDALMAKERAEELHRLFVGMVATRKR